MIPYKIRIRYWNELEARHRNSGWHKSEWMSAMPASEHVAVLADLFEVGQLFPRAGPGRVVYLEIVQASALTSSASSAIPARLHAGYVVLNETGCDISKLRGHVRHVTGNPMRRLERLEEDRRAANVLFHGKYVKPAEFERIKSRIARDTDANLGDVAAKANEVIALYEWRAGPGRRAFGRRRDPGA